MSDFARRVLDALPMTVYTTDLEGRITSANRAWSAFANENGAPSLSQESDVYGASLWSAFADPAYRSQMRSAMERLQTGRANRVAWEFPCDSPTEERVFLLQITALRGAEDELTGYVFSTVDITASHKSREALIDAGLALARPVDLERVFFEVAEQVGRAIPCEAFAVWIHPEGLEPALAYSTQNPTGEALDPALLRGAAAAMNHGLFVEQDLEEGRVLAAPMTPGETTGGAMALVTRQLLSRQDQEEAKRVLATLAAQTGAALERVQLVRRLGQKRRLEAIGEVATGVAHELRNPLFGISSAAQLLRFRDREDPVVDRNVGRILKEVERLNRMVTSLLEFGRPKPIALNPGDPDAVWDDVLDGQRGLLEARAVGLRRSRPDAASEAMVDPEQLSQVFLNLLMNAVDHAPPGSELILKSSATPNGWRCDLTNGGPAVSPDILARVFEMFFSTKSGGTGIGLAVCQRIVEEHGGTIGMASSPAAGTTVSIALPPV